MKHIYKTIFILLIFSSTLLFNRCDPFEDFFLTMTLDTEINAYFLGSNFYGSSDFCLSDFDDYNDNSDNLNEIRYISSAYFTLNSSSGLKGDTLHLRLYEGDGSTLLIDFKKPNFVADDYINKPLKIDLTNQEINNLNQYLANFKVNNCFKAYLGITNATSNNLLLSQLNAKVEFLTELKIEPDF